MNIIRNQKGVTLLEVLITTIVIVAASTIFITFILNYAHQKELQKSDILLTNLATKNVEEYYAKITTDPSLILPFTETATTVYGKKEYTIKVDITKAASASNPSWVEGAIAKLEVKVSRGKKSKVVTTYVYKK
jgi:Tfp pilus assembly protein PilE